MTYIIRFLFSDSVSLLKEGRNFNQLWVTALLTCSLVDWYTGHQFALWKLALSFSSIFVEGNQRLHHSSWQGKRIGATSWSASVSLLRSLSLSLSVSSLPSQAISHPDLPSFSSDRPLWKIVQGLQSRSPISAQDVAFPCKFLSFWWCALYCQTAEHLMTQYISNASDWK